MQHPTLLYIVAVSTDCGPNIFSLISKACGEIMKKFCSKTYLEERSEGPFIIKGFVQDRTNSAIRDSSICTIEWHPMI